VVVFPLRVPAEVASPEVPALISQLLTALPLLELLILLQLYFGFGQGSRAALL